MKENTRYYYTLDLLKFVMSVMIFLHHFQFDSGIRFKTINFCDGFFYFGYLVELFFIISGFLCAEREKTKPNKSLKEFFLPKVLRFYPMCWLSITCILILEIVNKIIFGTCLSTDGIGIWKIINNYALTFDGSIYYVEGSLGFNNPLWYICVLLLCYIFYFYINRLCDKKGYNISTVSFLIVLFCYWMYTFNRQIIPVANRKLFRGIISFLLGTLFEVVYSKVKIKNKAHRLIRCVTPVIILFVFVSFVFAGDYLIDDQYAICLFVLFPAILFLCLSLNEIMTDVANPKVFKFIGKLSYELYVWHIFFNKLYLTVLRGCSIDVETNSKLILLIMVIINLGAAIIFERVDKRLAELSKKIQKRFLF